MTNGLARAWQRLRRRIGASGLLGLGLLALAALLVIGAARLQARAAAAHAQLSVRALPGAASVAPAPPLSPREQQARFVAGLPLLSQNAADLKQLFAAARKHRMALSRGDYQVSAEPGSPLLSYTASFATLQEYRVIKDFVADALRALPHAALLELRLERADAEASMLEARLRLTLTYRAR